jgi:hypothetical protein
MDGAMYNSQNTSKRKGADDKKYSEGWDRIFGNKQEDKKDVKKTSKTKQ